MQSYFHREIFTICFLLATGWPFAYGLEFVKRNVTVILAWIFGCFGMSTFTLLPVVKIESTNMMLVGSCMLVLLQADKWTQFLWWTIDVCRWRSLYDI